jgi:hypothetical protein
MNRGGHPGAQFTYHGHLGHASITGGTPVVQVWYRSCGTAIVTVHAYRQAGLKPAANRPRLLQVTARAIALTFHARSSTIDRT